MTLTQTAILTKRLLLASIIIIFLGLSTWVGFIVYKANLPPPSPEIPIPKSEFGKLPRPLLPQDASASASNYTFALDTETGDLPKNIPTITKVFVVPQSSTSLLANEKVKKLAESFGFIQGPEILNSTTHRFSDLKDGIFTINLDTNNFKFERKVSSNSAGLQERTIADQTKIVTDFKTYLSNKGILNQSLRNGRSNVTYNSPSQQESTEAEVSIWPDKLDNLEIVTPYFKRSLVTSTITKFLESDERFIKMNYTFWQPDESTASTYAIKTPQTAYEDLKLNKGSIIIHPTKNPVSITSIYLAYYQPDAFPTYIQPVYVFEGPDFVAYIPAITEDYLTE